MHGESPKVEDVMEKRAEMLPRGTGILPVSATWKYVSEIQKSYIFLTLRN